MNLIDEKLLSLINSNKVNETLDQIYQSNNKIFPKKMDIFRAFELCPLSKTRVVIFGQDPYYQNGVADGLAFSTNSKKTPPSLQNIFKEIKKQYPNSTLKSNSLVSWAKQGVLLLNSSLTVEENKPMSHYDLWTFFIDEIINLLNLHKSNIIFVLWGNEAKKLKRKINFKKNYILESSHPSPLSFNKSFKGNNHFLKINIILSSLGEETICWDT